MKNKQLHCALLKYIVSNGKNTVCKKKSLGKAIYTKVIFFWQHNSLLLGGHKTEAIYFSVEDV